MAENFQVKMNEKEVDKTVTNEPELQNKGLTEEIPTPLLIVKRRSVFHEKTLPVKKVRVSNNISKAFDDMKRKCVHDQNLWELASKDLLKDPEVLKAMEEQARKVVYAQIKNSIKKQIITRYTSE